jgi:hypothetical protein
MLLPHWSGYLANTHAASSLVRLLSEHLYCFLIVQGYEIRNHASSSLVRLLSQHSCCFLNGQVTLPTLMLLSHWSGYLANNLSSSLLVMLLREYSFGFLICQGYPKTTPKKKLRHPTQQQKLPPVTIS